jgi:uncharacterized protein (UPF0210 family)
MTLEEVKQKMEEAKLKIMVILDDVQDETGIEIEDVRIIATSVNIGPKGRKNRFSVNFRSEM